MSTSWLLPSCSFGSCGLVSVVFLPVHSLGLEVRRRRLRRRSRRAQLWNIFFEFSSSV